MGVCCSRYCAVALFLLSILVFSAGLALLFLSPIIFQSTVDKQVVLTPGSDSFNNWKDMPAPTYMSFRVFDVQNPREVTSQGKPPAVKEAGVVVYREHLSRVDVVVHQNGSLSYRQPRTYIYEPELSTIDPNVTVTNVNIPLLAIVYRLNTLPSWVQRIVDEIIELLDGSLFIQKTVGELIWGYDDPLLKRIDQILKNVNVSIPYQIGIFAGRNGSDDGLFNVFSGAKDAQMINSIFTWNYNLNLPYWNTEYANQLNGTDGTLFKPGLQPSDRLYLFSTDVCRSLFATFVQSRRNQFDIDVLRFEIPDEVFADHERVPANADFCTPPGNCLKAGVLNVSACRDGLPIVISLPHFYLADPSYQNAIVGLNPNHDEHASYFDLEPFTGAALNASKRLQINVPLKRVQSVADMRQLPNTTFFFPVAWIAESGQLTPELADEFKNAVYVPHTILTLVIPVVLLALSVIFAVAVLTIVFFNFYHRKNDETGEREHLTSANHRADDVNGQEANGDGIVNTGTTPIEQSMNANNDE